MRESAEARSAKAEASAPAVAPLSAGDGATHLQPRPSGDVAAAAHLQAARSANASREGTYCRAVAGVAGRSSP